MYNQNDKTMTKEDIISIANELANQRNKAKHQKPYNVFTAWNMGENDHTKLLLALLRYQDDRGRYPLLNSFLNRFTKGRDRMIYYQHPSNVSIRFNPRYDKDAKHSSIDGLIMFSVNNNKKRIAVIIENKIFDAPDQQNQIRRYIKHMMQDEKIEKGNVWVLYLTGDGTKEVDKISYNPRNENDDTDIGHRFVALSYKEDVINWLKTDVLETRTYPEALTSIVRAYVESLEKDLFCEDEQDELLKNLLCKILIKHHNLKKLSEEDICTLYSFRDDVQKIRKASIIKDENDIHAVDNLYGVIKNVLFNVEQMAFDVFEKCSVEILNDRWKSELKKLEGVQWIAKHRGLGGKWGFVQISLTDEWYSNHLEWIPVNAKSMCCNKDNEYTLELHVEGNKSLAEQFRSELDGHIQFSPKCKKGNKGTRTVLSYKAQASKPIAKMDKKELSAFLTKVYTEDLNYCCRLLIEEQSKKTKSV